MGDAVEHGGIVVAKKGAHAGNELIKHDAEGKEIGAAVHCPAGRLLGCHVGEGPDGHAGFGHLRVLAQFGETEIEQGSDARAGRR